MVSPPQVVAALARVVREMQDPQDVDVALEHLVRVAQQSMAEVDHVGITLAHRDGTVVTRAASDDVALRLDRAQYDAGEGPCLHALDADTVVRVEHARHEQRWPGFIAVAVEMGLRSQLGIRLHVDSQTMGSLNMYSVSSDTISDDTEQLAELFAANAGILLGHAQRVDNLNAALASRKTIGLALGLLMQRLGIDEDTAFTYLTRLSASSQTKLRDVAASVVEEHRQHVDARRRQGA